MPQYKPYSPEWSRQRYLREALESYFDAGVDNVTIYNDLVSILAARANRAYAEFARMNELEAKFHVD